MSSRFVPTLSVVALAFASMTGSSLAVTTFVENFNTNASNWLTGASTSPTYNATGGVGDSGYISYTSTFTSGTSGPFGAPPLQLLFRGNDAANASGDAFVGNWFADGTPTLSITVRHNYSSALNLYARLDAGSGAAASMASAAAYAVESGTWTTVIIPIVDSNPPFLSYGAGTFSGVFSSIDNLQFGFYLPSSTTFTDFRMDIDNVTLNVIPEPASIGLIALGGVGAMMTRRRRQA